MSSITGIELGPDSCVLTRVRPVATATEVSALHVIEPAEWPPFDAALTATLRDVRRRKSFSRRAVVALWALTEPADPDAPHVRPLIRPLTSAGFRVDRVLTVPEALAAVARTRRRTQSDAAVWLALNTHGAAIAIVRDADLLYSRVVDWQYSTEVVGQRAEWLQRYSLIARLAPEVRRGITAVRNMHGVSADVAITCGNLPDLRSLTMPLVEELNLEVETLDSTEGLTSIGGARIERFAESAPAMRLAVGAALSRASAPSRQRQSVRTILTTAAAAAIVGGGVWISRQFDRSTVRPANARVVAQNASRPAAPPPAAQQKTPAPTAQQQVPPPVAQQKTPPPVTQQQTPPPATPAQQPALPQPKVTPPAIAQQQKPAPTPTPQPQKPAPTPTPQPQTTKPAAPTQAAATSPPKSSAQPPTPKSTPPPQTAKPAPQIASLPPTTPAPQKPSPPAPSTQSAPPAPKPQPAPVQRPSPPAQTQPPPVQTPPAPVETRPREAEPRIDPVVLRQPPPARRPAPLKEPIPSVDSILISRDRRVAVVGGAIVRVGDSVGSRVVVQIERDAVVLREPSGFELRIALRSAGVMEF